MAACEKFTRAKNRSIRAFWGVIRAIWMMCPLLKISPYAYVNGYYYKREILFKAHDVASIPKLMLLVMWTGRRYLRTFRILPFLLKQFKGPWLRTIKHWQPLEKDVTIDDHIHSLFPWFLEGPHASHSHILARIIACFAISRILLRGNHVLYRYIQCTTYRAYIFL